MAVVATRSGRGAAVAGCCDVLLITKAELFGRADSASGGIDILGISDPREATLIGEAAVL